MKRESDRYLDLAHALRELRTAAGLTQTELALALDKPQSYVSKYESGERRLDLIELETLARALGLTLSQVTRHFEESSQ
jgi:transcriptional regulator with XRE-family HTH domain